MLGLAETEEPNKPEGRGKAGPTLGAVCSGIEAARQCGREEELKEIAQAGVCSGEFIKFARKIDRGELYATKGQRSEALDPIKAFLMTPRMGFVDVKELRLDSVQKGCGHFVCGMQSLAIDWACSEAVEHNGFLYNRIKEGTFMASENVKYTIIVIKTTDAAVGVIIAVPSNSLSHPLFA